MSSSLSARYVSSLSSVSVDFDVSRVDPDVDVLVLESGLLGTTIITVTDYGTFFLTPTSTIILNMYELGFAEFIASLPAVEPVEYYEDMLFVYQPISARDIRTPISSHFDDTFLSYFKERTQGTYVNPQMLLSSTAISGDQYYSKTFMQDLTAIETLIASLTSGVDCSTIFDGGVNGCRYDLTC